MVINIRVQYNGGILPDIILLTLSEWIAYTEQGENHETTMTLDGVSYSAIIQYCRVMLSRHSRTLLLSVFSRASTEYFCL